MENTVLSSCAVTRIGLWGAVTFSCGEKCGASGRRAAGGGQDGAG
jgi:hypothetical protein